jgi:ABC-type multidrug transport system fused ATPase/permease subunit
MSAGTWFFCLFAVPAVFFAVQKNTGFFRILREAALVREKLKALFELPPLVLQSGEVSAFHLKGGLELSGVSVFSGGEELLDKVSLKIPDGQKTALVGFSAESLACFGRVVSRLCEYDEGELRVDGKDILTLDSNELREKIDFVPREALLFEGTLEENIRCGCPSASEEEILRAATRLGRGDWLRDIPDGISAAVHPEPSWAPFVPLARTLVKKPVLAVIDEPAPLPDPLAEVRLQEAVYSVMAAQTCIVIARRLSTLRQADRIIVFDKGRPAEDGSHDELLASGGLYAKIYEAFFRHQSPDYFHKY